MSNVMKAIWRGRMKLAIRNDWKPARLTKPDVAFIVATIWIVGQVRAFDYVYGQDTTTIKPIDGRPPTVFLLSEIVPLNVYGLGLSACLGLLVVGWLLRSHQIVWWGHGLSWVLYVVLFVGTLIPVFSVPYLDGIRGATALVTPAVIHFLLWMRTGPMPLEDEVTEVKETTRGPQS